VVLIVNGKLDAIQEAEAGSATTSTAMIFCRGKNCVRQLEK
jgi:hypothetical protein